MDAADRGAEIAEAGEFLPRARTGDADAFCSLTEPLQSRLLRQAAALSGDLGVAEDLVSETLVEAWKSLSRYDESCRLSTWLYAILLHRCQKWARRTRSRPVVLAWLPTFLQDNLLAKQQSVPSTDASPAEKAVQNENSALMRQCIGRLSEKHRQVILLRFYEDATLPDMARVLGLPAGTVKSRLHHALEGLRKIKMNLSELKGDTQI